MKAILTKEQHEYLITNGSNHTCGELAKKWDVNHSTLSGIGKRNGVWFKPDEKGGYGNPDNSWLTYLKQFGITGKMKQP